MTDGYDFKVGDSVRMEDSSHSFTVVRADGYGCVVQGKSGRKIWVPKETLHLQCDRKTAFLTELQALLRKYDARIGDSGIYEIEGIEITFGDDTPRVRYGHSTITADNIMDFDKE